MSEAQRLIERLTAQGCFTSDLRIEPPPGCTCTREETTTPGLARFVWDENCPVHQV
jgi:hypothetical protein